jgi:hypothetical protein
MDNIRWMGPSRYRVPVYFPGQRCEALILIPLPVKILVRTNSSSCGATNSSDRALAQDGAQLTQHEPYAT